MAEGADDRERRQHRIERALVADQLVALQDAGAVREVDAGAAQAEADLGEQLVGVGERRRGGRQAAVADHHHAGAACHRALRPGVERARLGAAEPGDHAAGIGGALDARQFGVDVPVGQHEAEIVERHFGEAVNAGQVGPRLLAAVVEGHDLAAHRLGGELLAEPLGARRPTRTRARASPAEECGRRREQLFCGGCGPGKCREDGRTSGIPRGGRAASGAGVASTCVKTAGSGLHRWFPDALEAAVARPMPACSAREPNEKPVVCSTVYSWAAAGSLTACARCEPPCAPHRTHFRWRNNGRNRRRRDRTMAAARRPLPAKRYSCSIFAKGSEQHDIRPRMSCVPGADGRAGVARRRRSGRRFLSRQDAHHAGRDLAGRRLRPARAAGRPPHRPPHSGRARDRRRATCRARSACRPPTGSPQQAPRDGTVRSCHHAEHVGAPGARRRQGRVRHPQVLLDRQHHHQPQRGEFLAHHRHPHHPGRDAARARGRRARHRHLVGLLSEGDERARRHQVQDRLRLSGRQRRQPGDGARRGRRPRLQFLGVVEIDQAALARGEEDLHPGADRASSGIRSLPTCRS